MERRKCRLAKLPPSVEQRSRRKTKLLDTGKSPRPIDAEDRFGRDMVVRQQ